MISLLQNMAPDVDRPLLQSDILALSNHLLTSFLVHRPLAAWKNSTGRYEISRETVSVDEEAVELKLVKPN